jgi:hypothetical protein
MGRACNTTRGKERSTQGFSGEKRDHLEDPDVDRGIKLKWFFKKWD